MIHPFTINNDEPLEWKCMIKIEYTYDTSGELKRILMHVKFLSFKDLTNTNMG